MLRWIRAIRLGCAIAAFAAYPALAAENVKITLNWLPGEASIGIIYADALGYYDEAGIDLEIEPGKGSGATSQIVAAGNTDVGLANGPSAVAIAVKGAPIKIIAPIYQAAEWGVISLKDAPISTPKDLEGKRIALAPGSADIPLFDTMLSENGVDKSKIDIVSADAATFISLLAEGKVDGVSETPSEVMVPLAERGVETKILSYKSNGAPLVSLSIIARDDKLKQNPDLYRRFIDATLRGYSAVVKDPEAAVDAVLARYPDAEKKERLLQGLTKYSIPAYCAPGASGLGRPPAELWAVTEKILTQNLGSLGDGGIKAMYTEGYLPSEVPPCP
ncbi:ABC transporter substrate-binding protein [Mesorhizobium sp. LNJC405B00]|uniref:ABC transporter substrate-binding protein n=1 Tax=Mesorhizobium sp. LNJC405B00 TaxID=1287281 RepID=UPI0003CF5C8F|nr:ABC transporter substrate-binding protein [Mesorhizobium sp. LNJC405B00]ESX84275.1 hypothetical protein X755_31925 [Mesorhizobium sp. LNJC405B00]